MIYFTNSDFVESFNESWSGLVQTRNRIDRFLEDEPTPTEKGKQNALQLREAVNGCLNLLSKHVVFIDEMESNGCRASLEDCG